MPATELHAGELRCQPPSLAALRRGDEAAWTAAFESLWPVALAAARHPFACLTGAEAEEVASETLAQLVSQVHRAGSHGHLQALTATIAFRKAISIARKKSASKRGAGARSIGDASEATPTPPLASSMPDSALSDADISELVLLLRWALSDLDPETRMLIEEKHVQGCTYDELSARHGLPLGTVCAKVARGLHKVRDRLDSLPGLTKELKAFLR